MKILFLQKRPLFPADTGGKIRTLNVLRHLAHWHEVTYLCNVMPDEADSLEQMRNLGLRVETLPWRETSRQSPRFAIELMANLWNDKPFNVAKDFDVQLRRRASQLLASERFDLVICDFVQMAANVIDLDGTPKMLFQHNVEAEIFERHAARDRGWLRRKYMGHQATKMRRFEGMAGAQFDTVIAVSERDRQQFGERYGWSHVEVIDTAVDVEFFRPTENGSPDQQQQQQQAPIVSFVGSMDWLPNEDGVQFLVEDIWPRIRATHPHARLQIVGRNPTAEIRKHDGHDEIEVTGRVPDVRPYYADSTVNVVPLRIGGGTRIKIYEAMAMGKPVVSTSLGAEGLSVTDGRQIELADTAEQFASKVSSLLSDAERREKMGEAARSHVVARYSSVTVARQFDDICRRTVSECVATQTTAKGPTCQTV